MQKNLALTIYNALRNAGIGIQVYFPQNHRVSAKLFVTCWFSFKWPLDSSGSVLLDRLQGKNQILIKISVFQCARVHFWARCHMCQKDFYYSQCKCMQDVILLYCSVLGDLIFFPSSVLGRNPYSPTVSYGKQVLQNTIKELLMRTLPRTVGDLYTRLCSGFCAIFQQLSHLAWLLVLLVYVSIHLLYCRKKINYSLLQSECLGIIPGCGRLIFALYQGRTCMF